MQINISIKHSIIVCVNQVFGTCTTGQFAHHGNKIIWDNGDVWEKNSKNPSAFSNQICIHNDQYKFCKYIKIQDFTEIVSQLKNYTDKSQKVYNVSKKNTYLQIVKSNMEVTFCFEIYVLLIYCI